MKLSTRARYALRMMLDIARNGRSGDQVSLASVAERTDLSRGYLEQLAAGLRNARLLRAASGRRGGYRLAVSPAEITIRQILQAAIGPICVVDCLEEPATCPRAETCECRVVYQLINRGIADALEAYTLADLLDPSWVRTHGERQRLARATGSREASVPAAGLRKASAVAAGSRETSAAAADSERRDKRRRGGRGGARDAAGPRSQSDSAA
jgi:Rrf2 family protein